ncbi:MAG: hypothetical protein KGH81_05805 [Thaumarchaeota archaeon]|nr:hypothetical protein [Nitrososphaerota archaeon]
MDKKQLILLIAGLAIAAIFLSSLTSHIPNVKFYDTSINKNQIHVGESAVISLNVLSNEKNAKNTQIAITAVGANAEKYLSFPNAIALNDIETMGGVASQDNKYVTMTATDMTGTATPFDIKLDLKVNGVTTDTILYHITIV